jgi:hypothetical protein
VRGKGASFQGFFRLSTEELLSNWFTSARLPVRYPRPVNIARHRDAGMAKLTLHIHRGNLITQKKGSVAVPHIVDADFPESGRCQNVLESPAMKFCSIGCPFR